MFIFPDPLLNSLGVLVQRESKEPTAEGLFKLGERKTVVSPE